MSNITGNEPMNPTSMESGYAGVDHAGNPLSAGLTIRHHFASLTFAALISSPIDYGMNFDMLAQKAVNATDILISELNKEK